MIGHIQILPQLFQQIVILKAMQITLSQAQTHALETLIKQGQYSSLAAVLDAALLLLIDEAMLPDVDNSPEYLAWAEATQRKIDTAQKQSQQGEVLAADTVLDQLRAKVQAAKKALV